MRAAWAGPLTPAQNRRAANVAKRPVRIGEEPKRDRGTAMGFGCRWVVCEEFMLAAVDGSIARVAVGLKGELDIRDVLDRQLAPIGFIFALSIIFTSSRQRRRLAERNASTLADA